MINEHSKFEEDLLNFLMIPTVTKKDSFGNYFTERVPEALDYLNARYQKSFDEVKVVGTNLLLHQKGSNPELPPLVMNGHFDVVEFDHQWTKKTTGEISEDRIYGRGSVDMKGPIVSALSGWEIFLTKGKLQSRDLYFLLNSDEEGDSTSLQQFILKPEMQPLRNGYAVVLEPTALQIGIAQKGLVFYSLKNTGGRCINRVYTAVHDGDLSLDPTIPNAIEINVKLFLQMKEYISKLPSSSVLGNSTTNLGIIQGGPSGRDQPNGVPNHCESKFTVRYTPNNDFRTVENGLKEIVRAAESTFPVNIELLPYESYGGFETSPESAIAKAALEATHRMRIEKVRGAYHAYSNADFLARAGLEPIVFAPGNLKDGAHGADEFIAREEFAKGITAFSHLFEVFMP